MCQSIEQVLGQKREVSWEFELFHLQELFFVGLGVMHSWVV